MQRFLESLCVAMIVASPTSAAPPPASIDEPGISAASAAELIQPAIPAIDKGLAYLAKRQLDDGSFGTSGYERNAAVCALAGMAFLAGGSTPDRGPYGEEIRQVTDFLLAHTEDSGFIVVEGSTSHGPMYGHGFAALFLAEVYGMSPRDDLRDKLVKATELIVRTQNTEGGWRYQPHPEDADISVTICQIMALRAARNAGIHVPYETVDRCTDYVKRSQNADGGFRYMLPLGGSLFPRSAAGVVALYSAGIYKGSEIDRGLVYLDQFLPHPQGVQLDGHFFYGQYYAVQAMWQTGGNRWERWYPAIRDVLIARQETTGGWSDPISPIYGTAMATIILQMPNNCVPIFQR